MIRGARDVGFEEGEPLSNAVRDVTSGSNVSSMTRGESRPNARQSEPKEGNATKEGNYVRPRSD